MLKRRFGDMWYQYTQQCALVNERIASPRSTTTCLASSSSAALGRWQFGSTLSDRLQAFKDRILIEMSDIAVGAELVRRAFDAARASGKDEWRRMTIPVLKNRILTITGGHFREAEFGASSFRDFLNRLPPGLLTLDDSQSPGFVVLNTAETITRTRPSASYPRVRSDLWRAALDYSSGRRYTWDPANHQGRLATATDTGPFLPTATAQDLAEWRAAFAGTHSGDSAGETATRLQRWASESLPTAFLPARLRPLWNTELKRRVEERLQRWFRENNIEPPGDLVSTQEILPIGHAEVDRLRQFVISCVKAMTKEELADLRIPAGPAMRVKISDEQ